MTQRYGVRVCRSTIWTVWLTFACCAGQNADLLGQAATSPTVAGKAADSVFQVGAATVEITPPFGPLIVNGGFTERTVERMEPGSLSAHAVALADARTQIVMVVVDSCMIPRELADEVKVAAQQQTGIAADHILISATHTHSAPSVMDFCLGTRADPKYTKYLPARLVEVIVDAWKARRPARFGYAVTPAPQFTANRRWIRRSDTVQIDPFGERTIRAMMHPGHQNPEYLGPSGPIDPALSLLSFQDLEGRTIAVLANYSMHYFGRGAGPADYYGLFNARLRAKIAVASTDDDTGHRPVCMMSQGTSGDIYWADYSQPERAVAIEDYAESLADLAHAALNHVEYTSAVELGMVQESLTLARRVPDAARLAWARDVMQKVGDRRPRNQTEVYAEQAIYLHEHPQESILLQAIRINEVGLTAMPNEVYALTGLKLKAQSPLQPCINIELANGASGYIPPPEQHRLGGYNTWPARTAGLEVSAEPQIVDTLMSALERLAGRRRSMAAEPDGPFAQTVMESEPIAYWRLSDMAGELAHDHTEQHRDAKLTGDVAFYVDGPDAAAFSNAAINRCVHLVDGALEAEFAELSDRYSLSFWFWNGMPNTIRDVTATLFTGGHEDEAVNVTIAGAATPDVAGRLVLAVGNEMAVGTRVLDERQWHHLFLVRDGESLRLFVDGRLQPDVTMTLRGVPRALGHVAVGGKPRAPFPLEGKIDEVVVWSQALEPRDVAVLFGASHWQWDTDRHDSQQPRSPEQTVAATHVAEGYTLELVAAEPLIADPVAIDWAADGRLWVVEMHDYPMGLDNHGQPGGRVRVLEDTDHDGRYDRSTLLLEDIPFPTGVKAWHKGVLVTAAPEILYIEDTDGDGHLDVRESLFSGFFEGNQQLRVNGLRLGLDNWLHCASGSHHGGYGSDSQILAKRTGEVIALGSRDFRIHPDASRLEPESGPSQFGRNRNDWGDWFGVQNSYPLWHYVLEDRYLRRNTLYAAPDPRRQVVTPVNPKVYPARAPDKRYHSYDQAGRFTSACSGMVYRDDRLFDASDSQHGFTCEPFHNVVQHHVIERNGVSYRAHRSPDETTLDFFASSDGWCRPVMVRTGPDGALWVVDMYRLMIEHPQWLPEEGQREMQPIYRAGDDRGRIYRIVRTGQIPTLDTSRHDRDETLQLIAMLGNSNGWYRDLAQEILVARRDPASVAPLRELLRGDGEPLARLHALSVLSGIEDLTTEDIVHGLRDTHPDVRRLALQFSEAWNPVPDPIVERVAELTRDAEPRVRLQAACTLGESRAAVVGPALGRMLFQDRSDPFLVAATFSSLGGPQVASALQAFRTASGRQTLDAMDRLTSDLTLELVVQSIQRGSLEVPSGLLAELLAADAGRSTRDQMRFAAQLCERVPSFLLDAANNIGEAQRSRDALRRLVELAHNVALDDRQDESLRALAVQLMDRDQPGVSRPLLELVTSRQPAAVSQAALERLVPMIEPPDAVDLLQGWNGFSPELRARILANVPRRESLLSAFLTAVEAHEISLTDIDLAGRAAIVSAARGSLRERAEKCLRTTSDAERQAIVRSYAEVHGLDGDPQRGAVLFRDLCAVCHLPKESVPAVAPNLAAVTDRSVNALLGSILDPSRTVESRYQVYSVVMLDGQVKSGLIETETATSLSLVHADGQRESVLRVEIEEIHSTGKSLMPEGFESKLKPQDVADLIRFVQSME